MSLNPRVTARRPMISQTPAVQARVFIRVERCKGCAFCVEFCPQQVLKLSTDFNPKGFHFPVVVKSTCINCSLCVSLCPDYAIYSKSVGARPAAQPVTGPNDHGAKPGRPSQGSLS
jgi:2-oxoglutarate ferredoxin oxidoreductase subunit delta